MQLVKDFRDYKKKNRNMNKFILNFSDFILNESNKQTNLSNNYELFEGYGVGKVASFVEHAKDRLKDKIKYFAIDDESSVNLIVEKSNSYILSAKDVLLGLNNSDSSNTFLTTIRDLAIGAITIAAAAATIMLTKKYKFGSSLINLFSKSKVFKPEIVTKEISVIENNIEKLRLGIDKFQKEMLDYILQSKNPNVLKYQTNVQTFSQNLDKMKDGINKIEGVLKYDLNKVQDFESLNKSISKYKSSFADLQSRFGKGVEDFSKELDNSINVVLKPTEKANNLISTRFKKIVNDLDKFTNRFKDNISKVEIKPDDIFLEHAKEKGLILKDSQHSPIVDKKIKAFFGVSSLTAFGGTIYLLLNNPSLTEIFDDENPEMKRVSDLLKNSSETKELYAELIRDNTQNFNDNLGLNLDTMKFKDNKYKNQLGTYICYWLADIILERMQISKALTISELVNEIQNEDI
jgi:hypothetical protein